MSLSFAIAEPHNVEPGAFQYSTINETQPNGLDRREFIGNLLPASAYLLLAPPFCLFIWRLWRFTVLPMLYPQEPLEIPYWSPLIGLTISFFKDATSLFEKGLAYTRYTGEPFAFQTLGLKIYVLTDAEHIASYYKNSTTLSFDPYIYDFVQRWGFSGKSLKLAWNAPTPEDFHYLPNNPYNPKQKSIIHLSTDLFKRQFLMTQRLDIIAQKVLLSIERSLMFDKLPCALQTRNDSKPFSLRNLSQRTWIDAITYGLFGDQLKRIEPNITDLMIKFGDEAWKIVFGYPHFAAPRLYDAREKIMAALKVYMDLPEEERENEAWFTSTVIAAQKILGLQDHNQTTIILMGYWAANGNGAALSFWVLSYLVHDKILLEQIREETKPAFEKGVLDAKWLVNNCPRLEAVFYEALRMQNRGFSVRMVKSPTTFGNKVLSPGSMAIIPFLPLHHDPNVWGDNFAEFDAQRFLRNKDLSSSPSFRPFGGGTSICPGRRLTKHAVFSLVATLLYRMDIDLAFTPQEFPKLDTESFSLGINGPHPGHDVIVELKEAAHWAEKKQ